MSIIQQPAEGETWLRVTVDTQCLELMNGRKVLLNYSISTALNGLGEVKGSECMPCGWHRIRIRIGEGCPEGSVFVARRPTGEIYTHELAISKPERDWVLTRILWLTGLESGKNKGCDVDTLQRFIYIHGCPETEPMGVPLSHGCIRMHTAELIDLFNRVETGTRVLIQQTSSV